MTVPVGTPSQPRDLAAAIFAALTEEFFDVDGAPIPFQLRDKRNTQDDPVDELVGEVLRRRLPDGILVFSSGKPLVSPDLVVARPEETKLLIEGGADLDARRIVAVEVKKVNSDAAGRAARSTGIDYNSTPPCSTVKVESSTGRLLRVPAFYLFLLLCPYAERTIVRTLALVAGAVLNEDTNLYDEITGIRKKSIGLGTFGDGLDRQRPMLVFANPLGWDWLHGKATLLHQREDLADEQDLVRVREVKRYAADGSPRTFWCYRSKHSGVTVYVKAVDPFPTPSKRTTETTPRGRFRIDL
ncbi:hypothetical protein [Micromonospora sp. KC213]|uniref:hypothetical protein n=1 Tax=Micromonospora sp. KC213 TaxID=2530378 RepID=UPI00104C2EA3|nr:hypothetical protein [Micromonospora sp. KC213]TDC33025.1 hypothetical protein E1166_26125 [Micromonospora sp. KC213]